jgi:hypothetical protein
VRKLDNALKRIRKQNKTKLLHTYIKTLIDVMLCYQETEDLPKLKKRRQRRRCLGTEKRQFGDLFSRSKDATILASCPGNSFPLPLPCLLRAAL